MRRVLMLAALLSCAGGAITAAHAQKGAPRVTRDTDRDGVPDILDRCAATPAGTRVDATGCLAPQAAAPAALPAPAAAGAPAGAAPAAVVPSPRAPASQITANNPAPKLGLPPSGLPTSGAPVVTPGLAVAAPSPALAGAAPAGPPANRPAIAPQNAVTSAPVVVPLAAPPSAPPVTPTPAPAVVDSSMTAGFWVPNYTGRTAAARLDYGRMLALRLDSAVVALVEVFRGTTGQPLPGATDPNQLSTREKGRWARCRRIHLDLATMSDAVLGMKDSMPGGASLGRAALNLAEAFEALTATGECDNVGSMIEAPDRWAPWQGNYETSVRNFFRDWYTQLRAVHEADRAFARALSPEMPAGRQFPVPAGLPPTPPTIGAGR